MGGMLVGLGRFLGWTAEPLLRTPGMRVGLWPTRQGTPIAKDMWMLGVEVDELTTRVR